MNYYVETRLKSQCIFAHIRNSFSRGFFLVLLCAALLIANSSSYAQEGAKPLHETETVEVTTENAPPTYCTPEAISSVVNELDSGTATSDVNCIPLSDFSYELFSFIETVQSIIVNANDGEVLFTQLITSPDANGQRQYFNLRHPGYPPVIVPPPRYWWDAPYYDCDAQTLTPALALHTYQNISSFKCELIYNFVPFADITNILSMTIEDATGTYTTLHFIHAIDPDGNIKRSSLMHIVALKKSTASATGCDEQTLIILSDHEFFDKVICTPQPNFEPSLHIAEAISIQIAEGLSPTYLQLITPPDVSGEVQRIILMQEDIYFDDAQLQGSGVGGYYADGDQLNIYAIWASGCGFQKFYKAEKTVWMWNSTLARYEQTDAAWYTTCEDGGGARGWACGDDMLLNLTEYPTAEQLEIFNSDNMNWREQHGWQLLWGQEARDVLAELQKNLALQIRAANLWRNKYCCNYEDDYEGCIDALDKAERQFEDNKKPN